MNNPTIVGDWAEWIQTTTRTIGVDVEGASLLEIGPGHSLGIANALLLTGAKRVVPIDIRRLADPSDKTYLPAVEQELRRRGLLAAEKNPTVGRGRAGLDYTMVSPRSGWPFPNESFEIVYSFYSGEHLRAPARVLAEAYRVLKPGGVCLQRIDLKDHYDPEGDWLGFLRYDEWLWELMHSERGRWCNRLRAPQWRALVSEHFDEIVSFEEIRKPLPIAFDPEQLAKVFRGYSREDLGVAEIWLAARKSPAG